MNAELQIENSDPAGAPLHTEGQYSQAIGSVTGTTMQTIEQHPEWPLLSRLPMRLAAGIPCARFKIADLLALAPGQVIETGWPSPQEVRLRMGTIQVFWTEFEVVEQRLAVRLTRLA